MTPATVIGLAVQSRRDPCALFTDTTLEITPADDALCCVPTSFFIAVTSKKSLTIAISCGILFLVIACIDILLRSWKRGKGVSRRGYAVEVLRV